MSSSAGQEPSLKEMLIMGAQEEYKNSQIFLEACIENLQKTTKTPCELTPCATERIEDYNLQLSLEKWRLADRIWKYQSVNSGEEMDDVTKHYT